MILTLKIQKIQDVSSSKNWKIGIESWIISFTKQQVPQNVNFLAKSKFIFAFFQLPDRTTVPRRNSLIFLPIFSQCTASSRCTQINC